MNTYNKNTQLGTDLVGTTALDLRSSSLAPTTSANYDNNILRQFAQLCHEEGILPLQASTHSIVGYTACLGLRGTVTAASLQHD
jgi:tryptophan synthase beta subunit